MSKFDNYLPELNVNENHKYQNHNIETKSEIFSINLKIFFLRKGTNSTLLIKYNLEQILFRKVQYT